MNSLRKRAEQLLKETSPEPITKNGIAKRKNGIIELTSAKKTKNDSLNIYNLPVEIYYCIFENLDTFSILQSRQLNHHFKSIIDKCGFIWKKKIKLNHHLENQTKLENFIEFSYSLIPFVDSLNINLNNTNLFECFQ